MPDRDTVIAMAREAGFRTGNIALSNGGQLPFAAPISATDCMGELKAFAALVAAQEREQCAKVCDEQSVSKAESDCPSAVNGWWPDQVLFRCATAIRARKEET